MIHSELSYIAIKGIGITYYTTDTLNNFVKISIMDLQADNCLKYATFPIMIAPKPRTISDIRINGENPVIYLRFEWQEHCDSTMLELNKAIVKVMEIDIKAEVEWIRRILELLSSLDFSIISEQKFIESPEFYSGLGELFSYQLP